MSMYDFFWGGLKDAPASTQNIEGAPKPMVAMGWPGGETTPFGREGKKEKKRKKSLSLIIRGNTRVNRGNIKVRAVSRGWGARGRQTIDGFMGKVPWSSDQANNVKTLQSLCSFFPFLLFYVSFFFSFLLPLLPMKLHLGPQAEVEVFHIFVNLIFRLGVFISKDD